MDAPNTSDAAELLKGDHILLIFDKDTFGVQIHGNVANLDMAMAILTQAHRELETQWRIAKGIAAQQVLKQAAEDNNRVQTILGKSMRRN